MNLKPLLLYSVFSLSIVFSISGKANNRPYLSWNSERVSADSISVKKLDSLLRPFVLEALADIHLETKEDAHNYSERLLVDAASILSKNQIDREEALAALVSSLISQQIKEDFNLTEDFFYAILFQDQALYYAELGFHKRALEIEKKAMDIILENKNDPDYDIYYPDELERLADRYHNLNDIERAIDYQELANEFYLSHSLLDYYCVSLYRSACYYFENEEHAKSIDYFNRFLVSREEIKEEVDLEDIYELLCKRANSYLHIGDLNKALKDAELSLSVSKTLFGPGSLEYSNALSNYATSLTFNDEFEAAKDYFKQALSIIENNSEYAYDYMVTCDQYSIALIALGEYNEAKRYNNIALDYCFKNNIRDYDYAQALINSSRCSSYIGDYETCYALAKEAFQIEKELGLPEYKKNYGYYAALSSFAQSALYLDHLGDAERASRTILKEGKNKNLSAYISSYLTLSDIASKKGRQTEAMNYALSALECSREASMMELSALGQVAECDLKARNFDTAASLYSKCVSLAKERYGEFNLTTLYYKICHCFASFKKGERDSIKIYAKDINDSIKQIAANGLLGMTTREKYYFLERLGQWSEYVLPQIAISMNDDDLLCELYNAVLYYKGLFVFEERINNIAMHQNALLHSQLQELKLQYNKMAEKEGYDYAKTKSLLVNIDTIERNLLSGLNPKIIENYENIRNHSRWEMIKHSLTNKDIAIEFISSKNDSQTYYYALLLRAKSSCPQLIPLFCENDLPAKPNIKGSLPTNKELFYYSDYYNRLYTLIWEPLTKELKGVKRVFFSPTRELYAIGIEDASNNGKPLSENVLLKRMSSTLQLLDLNEDNYTGGQAILFGGLNMDSGNAATRRTESILTDGTRQQKFSDISQSTLEEVLNIQNLLQQNSIPFDIRTDKNGTEQQFKSLVESPLTEIIHIATHGIFVSEESFSRHRPDESTALIDSRDGFNSYQFSMKNSALALSGANHSNSYDEDDNGILTAKEISELNIPNLRLTVLSACQTGLGAPSFDGIAGLQRGFKIAGSKTIIMSLWDVNSEVTTKLMTYFYQELLNGKQKESAFKTAKKRIMHHHTNPYYWAAFIMLD